MMLIRQKLIFLILIIITLNLSVWADTGNDFFDAVKANDLPKVEQFLYDGVDINIQDDIGTTALMLAAENGSMEIVKYLIENGADVNLKNYYADTALIHAVWSGEIEIVRLFLDPIVPSIRNPGEQ